MIIIYNNEMSDFQFSEWLDKNCDPKMVIKHFG